MKYHYNRLSLDSIAHTCDRVISDARKALGYDLRGYSLLDLVADNLTDIPLETLKTALVVAGYSYK